MSQQLRESGHHIRGDLVISPASLSQKFYSVMIARDTHGSANTYLY